MSWAEEVATALDAALAEGAEPAYEEGFGPLTVTVPADGWTQALTVARDTLGCTFFDWLSAVDELADGFSVVCHLAAVGSVVAGRSETAGEEPSERSQANRGVQHLLLRTTLPRDAPRLASARDVFAGAGWHERETTEMFGIAFTVGSDDGEPVEVPNRHLLLPEEFEGHPLRKDFVLASRVVKPWPGAKEPGEGGDAGEHGSPSRRRTRPPGVPEPEAWGPRAPGSEAPDPLAHARPGAARPRRRAAAERDTPDETRRRGGRERPTQRREGQDSGEGEADG